MSNKDFSQRIILDVLEWIEENLDSPLSIENISDYSGYSKWHLQRLFKSETGYTLGKYIRNRKLTIIAQELKETDEPIIGLACRYGFESQQAFTRTFTQYFSVSPHKHRMTTLLPVNRYLHPYQPRY